jgi:DNA-binding XRE family transcriptional regulator
MKPDELKKIRKEIGARQKDFAVVLGVALRTYQNWEQPQNSREHRKIPDEYAEKVKVVVELIKEKGINQYPSDIVWLQVPLRKEDYHELRRKADVLGRNTSVLAREAIFKIIQTPVFQILDDFESK